MALKPIWMVFCLFTLFLLPSFCLSLDPDVCGGQEKALLNFNRCEASDEFFDDVRTNCEKVCEEKIDYSCVRTCLLQTIGENCGRKLQQILLQKTCIHYEPSKGAKACSQFIEDCMLSITKTFKGEESHETQWMLIIFIVISSLEFVALLALSTVFIKIHKRYRRNQAKSKVPPTTEPQNLDESIEFARAGSVGYSDPDDDLLMNHKIPRSIQGFAMELKRTFKGLQRTVENLNDEVKSRVLAMEKVFEAHNELISFIASREKSITNEDRLKKLSELLADKIKHFTDYVIHSKEERLLMVMMNDVVKSFRWISAVDYEQHFEKQERELGITFNEFKDFMGSLIPVKQKRGLRSGDNFSKMRRTGIFLFHNLKFLLASLQQFVFYRHYDGLMWFSDPTFLERIGEEDSKIKMILRFGMPKSLTVRFFEQYISMVDHRSRLPLWVGEHLGPDFAGTETRDGSFFYDKTIPSEFRQRADDYAKTGWDRGHLAAAANHSKDYGTMKETFTMSNMVPQNNDLNRYEWKNLEQYIRDEAISMRNVWIFSGPAFVPKGDSITYDIINKKNRFIAIPTHIWKCILYENMDGTLEMESILAPNNSSTIVAEHRTDREEIERVVGFKLYPGVPNSDIRVFRKKKDALSSKD